MRGARNDRGPEKRLWSAQVLGKYWLLQLPEAALLAVILLMLQHWFAIPTWVVWSVVALWVVKDAALYPVVWRSFDPEYPATSHSLNGEHGVATERLDRSGYVRVRGARAVEKDEPVQVQEMRGLTVIVVSVSEVRERWN